MAVIGASGHRCCDIISVRGRRANLHAVCRERSSFSLQQNLTKMAVESRVTQEEIKKEPEKPVDREKVRLLRLFVKWTNLSAQMLHVHD